MEGVNAVEASVGSDGQREDSSASDWTVALEQLIFSPWWETQNPRHPARHRGGNKANFPNGLSNMRLAVEGLSFVCVGSSMGCGLVPSVEGGRIWARGLSFSLALASSGVKTPSNPKGS